MNRPRRSHLPLMATALLGLSLGACGGTLYDPDRIPVVETGGLICSAPLRACGAECKAQSTLACGPSCAVCPGAPAGGTPVCADQGAGFACGFTCQPGFFSTGAACERATQVASGAHHACALTEGGAVLCWGANDAGQLGRSGAGGPGIGLVLASGASALAAGGRHTCAVQGSAVKCWGANDAGQLGNGTTGAGGPAVASFTLAGVTALAAGASHTCALVGGAVRCWGSNANGQQGTGATGLAVTSPGPVLKTGASLVSTFKDTTCALVSGTPWCWGANGSGQVGTTASASPKAPTAVTLPVAAIQLAAGGDHACALVAGAAQGSNGLYCWGADGSWQLGDGGAAGAASSGPVASISIDNQGRFDGLLGAGGQFTCASRAGEIGMKCGGANADQQSSPVAVGGTVSAADVVPPGRLLQQISLGQAHGCALVDTGLVGSPALTVECWGRNAEGQLGRPTTGGAADGVPAAVVP